MLDIKKDLTDYLSGKEDPCSLQSILKGLGFGKNDRQYLRSILAELVREGKVIRDGRLYWLPDGREKGLEIKRAKTRGRNQTIGVISINARGFGFVEVPGGRDWYIPEYAINGAKHGDIVLVEKSDRFQAGRTVARVVEIEEFGTSSILGVFHTGRWGDSFTPFGDFQLRRSETLGYPEVERDGMVGRWLRRRDGKWMFDGMVGHIDDHAIDEVIALSENGVISEFSEEVLAQAETFGQDFVFELSEDRRDFRDELVFTVDGADARDFDDALHFRMLEGNLVEVGIHIADVSAFVPEGSVLDQWAREQGNSTYLPHKALPMLPEQLSTNLCSLRPDVPRYTLSVVAEMTTSGKVQSYEVCKGLIKSKARLTYSEVAAISVEKEAELRGKTDPELVKALDLGIALSRKMRRNRLQSGAMDIDMPEVRLDVTPQGEFLSVREVWQTDANRMIEAFMVLANECVAEFMEDYSIPFRVHDVPSPEKLETLELFLKTYAIEIPDDFLEDTGKALNQIAAQLKDKTNAQVMQTQLLKAMKLAEYSATNLGHFGLNSTHYAHFTSPIRRYADLYIHQSLTHRLNYPDHGPEYYQSEHLDEICLHISKKERDSARAEMTYRTMKLLRNMTNALGEDTEGVIAEVKPYGIFVNLTRYYVSGLVHLENLDDDEYEYIPELLCMAGRHTGKTFRVGDSLIVNPVRIDLISRRLDLIVIEGGIKLDLLPAIESGEAPRREKKPRWDKNRSQRLEAGPSDRRGGRGDSGPGRGPAGKTRTGKKKVPRTLSQKPSKKKK